MTPVVHSSFNPVAKPGLMVFKRGSNLFNFRADTIDCFRADGPMVLIYGQGNANHYNYFSANYTVAHHFYLRSLFNGESFDLQDICDLNKKDPYFHLVREAPDYLEKCQELAKRVQPIKSGDFLVLRG